MQNENVGPLVKKIKNIKMVMAEHLTKLGALLGTRAPSDHTSQASSGVSRIWPYQHVVNPQNVRCHYFCGFKKCFSYFQAIRQKFYEDPFLHPSSWQTFIENLLGMGHSTEHGDLGEGSIWCLNLSHPSKPKAGKEPTTHARGPWFPQVLALGRQFSIGLLIFL